MKNALISILSPVKNEELHISAAIESVLLQTHQNFEYIIVDDSSADNTLNKLKEYASKDSRITVLSNSKVGKVSAFNLAYQSSKGDFFIFFAGDDILTPDSLEKRLEYIADMNVSYGQLITVSTDQKFSGRKIPKYGLKGHISGGTIMFNKHLSNTIFPLPETLPNEDTWTRLCIEYLGGVCGDVPHTVLKYRIHTNNSHDRYMSFAKMNEFLSIRNKAYDIFFEKNRSSLSSKDKLKIENNIECEKLRYRGSWLSILFMKNVSLSTKKTFFLNSNEIIYKIKLYFSFF